jgi:hypothetical protein
MLFKRFWTRPAVKIVRKINWLSVVLLIARADEEWSDQHSHRRAIYRDQFEIEQGVQIGAKKKAIAGMICFRPQVGNNWSCFQNSLHVAPGNRASPIVDRKQLLAKGGLPSAPDDRRQDALPRIRNPRRVELASLRQLMSHGRQ